MNSATPSKSCRLINVGMVVQESRWVSVVKYILQETKPSGLRLVAIANLKKSSGGYRSATEMGLEVHESYLDLLSIEYLDLILELTGDAAILSDILSRKRSSLGVLDSQASVLFLDMARHYAQEDRSMSDCAIEKSFASTLLEASPDGVLVIDREHFIIDCNKSPLIPGSSNKESVTGRKCFQVMHGRSDPCASPKKTCPAHITLKTGKLARTAYEIVGPDETWQFRQVTSYPIFGRYGEVAQVVVTIRDMTGDLSQRIEERTQELKKDLARLVQEDRLSSLGRLVASVCHEINNPITSIVTFTKLVHKLLLALHERGDLPAGEFSNMERYLGLTFREAMRCGGIVKNLLTFARPRSVEAKQIELTELIDTILLLVGHQLENANVHCELSLPQAPFIAWGDYAQIQQCLLNLLFNSIDAMPNGGNIIISGGTQEEADMIWLAVTDTGHGIEPCDLQRIFEPFYSTKTNGKGNGLGLSMVYGIVRGHNGAIDVESEPGKGTTFRIKLPRRPRKDREGNQIKPVSIIDSPKPIRLSA